jgi:hypothetical protein
MTDQQFIQGTNRWAFPSISGVVLSDSMCCKLIGLEYSKCRMECSPNFNPECYGERPTRNSGSDIIPSFLNYSDKEVPDRLY